MVPLEEKTGYLSRVTESHKLTAFNNLLLGKTIIVPESQDLNESEEYYFEIVNAIQKNKKVDFEKYFEKNVKVNRVKTLQLLLSMMIFLCSRLLWVFQYLV